MGHANSGPTSIPRFEDYPTNPHKRPWPYIPIYTCFFLPKNSLGGIIFELKLYKAMALYNFNSKIIPHITNYCNGPLEYNQQISRNKILINVNITFITSTISFVLIQISINSSSKSFPSISSLSFASTWSSPIDFISSMKLFTFLTKWYGTSLSSIVSHSFEWSLSIAI